MKGPPGQRAWVSTHARARVALSHPVFTGLSRQHLADLLTELADPWTAAHESALQQRRGRAHVAARRRRPTTTG